jgi:phosphotransferase system enzyme I (PtsI)
MNPFLGLRGIRMCLADTELFRTQLRAILRASAHGKVEIMFPMISSVEEFRQAARVVEDAKAELRSDRIKFAERVPVGAMIETPAAALVADLLAREAAFFSIGSNDLIQYAIAVDRGNQAINYLYQPLHPAILRLIRGVIDMAHAGGIKVTVCGEVAADPLVGVLLLGLGLDTFSVSPVSLSETKRIIRATSFADAKAVAAEAMTLPTAQAVKELVRSRLGERVVQPV